MFKIKLSINGLEAFIASNKGIKQGKGVYILYTTLEEVFDGIYLCT